MTDTTEEKPTRTRTAAAKSTAPHVYTALATILATLGVAKSGQLPSNMGGKPYITAVDVAKEVKTLFVANELIFLPTETIEHYEVFDNAGKKQIFIAVTGTYTIVSLRDSSSVVVSGTGDGLANGTAVASNIASTNAFKNALLRTFLITEQSAEDAAKNGDATDAGTRKVTAAAATGVVQPKQGGLKDQIREQYIENADSPYTKEDVNAFLAQAKEAGKAGEDALKFVLEKLNAGEAA